MVEQAADRVDMVLRASLESIEEAAAVTAEMLRARGLDRLSFEVGLLLREAMSNAVRHGSGLDAGRSVRFRCFTEHGQLVLEVEDDGPGFDWRGRVSGCHPGDVCLPPNDCESGRGLSILYLYSNDVEFNAAGNKVRVSKRL
jgi:anti-sigma regulatory factor (Ser/Thr protein kinase)